MYLLKVNKRNTKKVWNMFKVNHKDTRTTFYCFYKLAYFTPFYSVSAVDFEQVKVCWVRPYEFIRAKITYCCNYWQVYKDLSEIAAHNKILWPKVEKTFSPCRLLYLISRKSFFQSTEFLYFMKLFAANQSSIDTVFFRRGIANINCIYIMYSTDTSI